MTPPLARTLCCLACILAAPAAPIFAAAAKDSSAQATSDQLAFFEKKIRPVLVQTCYECHSAQAKKLKANFLIDTRTGIRKGGDNGPGIVPGDLDKSLVIAAIRWKDENLQMPPKKKLADDVIADFEKWVKMGAPDPREGTAVAKSDIDINKGKQYWAFQAPKSAAPPVVKNANWPRSDVDRFLLAAMETKQIKPVPDADRATLLRRINFDLIGLPPTSAEVEVFLADKSPDALEKVIDRLMASPAFGERWGRHWLDVARFAESSGKTVNFNYPHAWRYRDYVIDAFNADKPFNQFIREQVAGDLLPSKDEKQKIERTVATGFLAVGTKSLNEMNPVQFQMDLVDEQIDATCTAIMATTVACARCHDHKFDPIAQRDYYALAGIFRSTETMYGTMRFVQNQHPGGIIELPKSALLPPDRLTAQGRAMQQAQIDDLKKQRDEMLRDPAKRQAAGGQILLLSSRISLQEAKLDAFDAEGNPRARAMGARDRFRAADVPLLTRGDIDTPGDKIPRGLPQVLVTGSGEVHTRGSGRLELAEFLASDKNPLTARVWVNRVWLHLFGQGIVPTPDNFGAAGSVPSNQALLDHVAVQFMKEGWSTKKLVRELMLTRAYQLSSKFDSENDQVDPDNVLVWRASPRRLEAEPLRDAMLAVSGQLDSTRPIGSPVTRIGEGPSQQALRLGGLIDAYDKHRTVYMPIVRDQLPEVLATFDFADPSSVNGQRATTSVPSQMLFLMNSSFVINASDATATRLAREAPEEQSRIRQAYLKIYNRPPTALEVTNAQDFLSNYAATISSAANLSPAAKHDAWTAFVQSMMGSADFLYLK
jgi:cytochrome c553